MENALKSLLLSSNIEETMCKRIEDIRKMICIIKCLEQENLHKSKYIKELEEQHKKDCNAINVDINLK